MSTELLLSANIYCAHRVDAVIGQAILPFWRRIASEGSSYLWLIRHSRAGEHLKVRLHGPPELHDDARLALSEAVVACFAQLPAVEPPETSSAHASLPVIDPEDAADDNYPDRTLLWTTYRPSPVTLGASILAQDPTYHQLFTRVLGAGCRIALDLFATAPADGSLPLTRRQSTIFKICIATLQALPFDACERSTYLGYHRDWLVRWALAHSDPGTTTRETILELFDRKAAATKPTLDVLGRLLGQRPDPVEPAASDAQSEYREAVRHYFDYVSTFRGNPDYALDPYADDPVFLPVFKVLHNLANTVGLGIRHEAFAYHLLTLASAGVPS